MKTKTILLTLTTLFAAAESGDAQTAPNDKKVLVAYFSHSGNTRAVASVEHNIAHYWEMMQLSHHKNPLSDEKDSKSVKKSSKKVLTEGRDCDIMIELSARATKPSGQR